MSSLVQNSWSELPADLLKMIAEKFDILQDFLSFSGVCRPWRCVFIEFDKGHIYRKLKPPFPWLICMDSENNKIHNRCFFSPSENKFRNIYLPEARRCRDYWGSPYGWLVTQDFGNKQVNLLNPLSRARLPLPYPSVKRPYSEDRLDPQLSRAIVTISDDGHRGGLEFTIFVIIAESHLLAFARPGGNTWTPMEPYLKQNDIIHFNDHLYAVDYEGNTKIYDIANGCPDNPTSVRYASVPNYLSRGSGSIFYLVELSGELYMAKRYQLVRPLSPHVYFRVCKLNMNTLSWEKVESLGDYALFLGFNASFSIKASDYPGCCKPGRIYFTSEPGELVIRDMGVYNMETHELEEPFCRGEGIFDWSSPPVWIFPNPC